MSLANAIIGALRVSLGLETAAFDDGATNAERRLKRFQGNVTSIGQSLQRSGAVLSVALTAPLVGLATKSVAAFSVQEQAVAAVDAALRSMGEGAGFGLGELQDMASELQDKSLFGDEEILSKVTANLLTFGNISGQVFADAQQMALDLSARMKTDLQSSAIMLGKALNDPINGISALSEAGVSFTTEQRDMVRAMVEAGDAAGAQTLILAEMQKQFDGQAQALRDTDTGRISAMWMELGQVFEEVGAIILPVLADIADQVTAAAEWFTELDPATQGWAVAIGALAAALGPAVIGLGLFIAALSPIAGVVAAIGAPVALAAVAIGALGIVIYRNIDTIKGWISAVVEFGAALVTGIRDGIIAAKDWVVDGMAAVWQAITDAVSGWAQYFADLGRTVIESFKAGLVSAIPGLGAIIEDLRTEAASGLISAFDKSSDAEAMGADLANGVVVGVDGQLPWLRSAGERAGAAVEEGFRDHTDTRSPSRLFATLGAYVMQGLGLGIQDGTPGAVAAMAGAADQIADTIHNRMKSIGGWLADLLTGQTTVRSSLSNWLSGGANSLKQSAWADITGLLGNSLGPSLGGLASGLFGGLLGFRDGADFQVGGVGGIDSQVVAFRASPNERVQVTRPDQQAAAMGAGVLQIMIKEAPGFAARVEALSQGVAMDITRAGLADYDAHMLPESVRRVSNDPRLVG